MSKGPTRAALQAQVDDLERQVGFHIANVELRDGQLLDMRTRHRNEIDALQKQLKEKTALVNTLRDELMAATISYAEMRGYVTRSNEEDPQPAPPVRRSFGDTPRQHDGTARLSMPAAQFDFASGERRVGWWNFS